jgi:hypothetical protein
MTRRNQRYLERQSSPQDDKHAKQQDDVIIPEIIDTQQQLVNPQVVQIFVERDKTADLEKLLDSVVNYNERRLRVIREHAEKHPDAVENRQTRKSRRYQYMVLLALSIALLLLMPFVNLAVAGVFGIIAVLIVCGILVNARERELDLQGFLKMINIVMGRQK